MFEFGTKAETLESLRPHLKLSEICPSLFFTVHDWETNATSCLGDIQTEFPDRQVIVRSSARCEDSIVSAMAGVHASVPDVSTNSLEELRNAIDQVIESYGDNRYGPTEDQVLVQPMVHPVSMSGVVFTQDLNTGGPYYVINYDEESGRTDTVTSGQGDANRTLLVHRGYADRISSVRFRALLEAVLEVESLSPSRGLDIEFGVTKDNRVFVFQVRRLAVQQHWNREISSKVDHALDQTRRFLRARFGPRLGAVGQRSMFGVMPDWNPAEMIGTAPRALAASLYRCLITDSVWAEARASLGYRDQSGCPRASMRSAGSRSSVCRRSAEAACSSPV